LKGKPLLDMVGGVIEDYEFLWDQYYFPTATLWCYLDWSGEGGLGFYHFHWAFCVHYPFFRYQIFDFFAWPL